MCEATLGESRPIVESENPPLVNCDCSLCREWKEIIRRRLEIRNAQDIDKISHSMKEKMVELIREAADINDEKDTLEEEVKQLRDKVQEYEAEALERCEYDY